MRCKCLLMLALLGSGCVDLEGTDSPTTLPMGPAEPTPVPAAPDAAGLPVPGPLLSCLTMPHQDAGTPSSPSPSPDPSPSPSPDPSPSPNPNPSPSPSLEVDPYPDAGSPDGGEGEAPMDAPGDPDASMPEAFVDAAVPEPEPDVCSPEDGCFASGTVDEVEPNDEPGQTSTRYRPGVAIRSTSSAGDDDWFAVDIPAGSGVLISNEDCEGDTEMALHDHELGLINEDDDTDGSCEALYAGATGYDRRVWVRVQENYSAAPLAYTLTATPVSFERVEAEPNDTATHCQPIAADAVIAGVVSPSTDRDHYCFSVVSPDTHVRLETRGQHYPCDMDTYLRLFSVGTGDGGSDVMIAQGDDRGDERELTACSLIETVLQPGDYVVELTSYRGRTSGAYTVQAAY